jgi:hypothetical protein
VLLVGTHTWPQKGSLAEAFEGGLRYGEELKVIVSPSPAEVPE